MNDGGILAFGNAAESWLAENHEQRSGVWLKIAKKGSGKASVTPAEALNVALCFGWIDSQRRSHDEEYFLQRYSRRRPKNSWSKVNVNRVEALIAAGRMRVPGLEEVRSAKADGRWDAAYESQRSATMPPDLAAALGRNEQARGFFESLARSEQYAVILHLMKAGTAANRAARLRSTIARLEKGNS